MDLLFADFSGLPDDNVKTKSYRHDHSESRENRKIKRNPTSSMEAGFHIEALRSKLHPTASRGE